MKPFILLVLTLTFSPLLLSGCVSRTTTSEPSISDLQKGIGHNTSDRITKKKIVWIWQEEYRNPQ
jgi:hypothetical protein